jgi:hypothetical protein
MKRKQYYELAKHNNAICIGGFFCIIVERYTNRVVVYADKQKSLLMTIHYDEITCSEYFCNKSEHTITEFYYDSI